MQPDNRIRAMANVLVRFCMRCRPDTFLAEEGYEKLNAAIRKVYSDILSDEQRFFLHIDVPEGLKHHIRESVDSLCRDDADMPMPPYIRKACNRPNAAFVSLFR